MNPVDIVVFVFVFVMAIRGLIKGFVRELFGLAALVIGIVVAHQFHASFGRMIADYIKINLLTANIAAFFIIFFSVYIVLFLIGLTISTMIRKIDLGFIDRVFGLAFGVTKAGIIILLLVLFIDSFSVFKPLADSLRKDSKVFGYVERFIYTSNVIDRLEEAVVRRGL